MSKDVGWQVGRRKRKASPAGKVSILRSFLKVGIRLMQSGRSKQLRPREHQVEESRTT
jgi:hypothetical protein